MRRCSRARKLISLHTESMTKAILRTHSATSSGDDYSPPA